MSKNISKRNEEKLRVYLSKVNDIKSNNKKDQNTGVGAQAGKKIQNGVNTGLLR